MSLKIDNIYAFICTDKDGNEGIIGHRVGGTMMPFVMADVERIKQLRPIAEEISKEYKTKITLSKFSVRTDLEVI